ncbi:MAG: NADH-quinone oxidoreductase subunit I [Bacteroidetes bacterium]|nr:NADH-quinone oxidoreductase subunit I [Bacteroidota bacterium]
MIRYIKDLLKNSWALLVGLAVTMRYMFRPKTTVQFPEQKKELGDRYIGYVKMMYETEGEHAGVTKCVACMACVVVCPVSCIQVTHDKHPDPTKKRIAKEFILDYVKCEFCNLCVEACNFDAIIMGHDYELALYDRSVMDMVLVKDMKYHDDLYDASRRQTGSANRSITSPREREIIEVINKKEHEERIKKAAAQSENAS